MAEQSRSFMRASAQRVDAPARPEQRVRSVQRLQGSVQGAGVKTPLVQRAQFQRPQAQADTSTFDALKAMGDQIVDRQVQRKQQELFYEGARKQIEGEALADIVNDQPWYSKVFGPSASVQGARAMAEMQAVQEFTTGMQEDMGQLRQLNSDEFQQELFTRMDEVADIGDPTTSVAIQSQLLDSMGPLVRSHTKEHAAYVQENMQSQQVQGLVAGAKAMKAGVRGLQNGTLSQQDHDVVLNNVLSVLQPIEGQNADSYWSGIESATQEAMAQGNFHFVNVVQDALYEHMPIEQRKQFLADRRKFEIQTAKDRSAGQYSAQIANIKAYSSEGLVSAQATWDNIAALNRQYRADTGIDRDLIDASAAEGILTNNVKGIIKEQKAAQKAAQSLANERAKAAAEAEAYERKILLGSQLFLGGMSKASVAQGGYSTSEMQSAAAGTLQGIKAREDNGDVPPGTWANAVAQTATENGGYVVTSLSDRLKGALDTSVGGDLTPAVASVLADFQEIRNQPGGEVALARYAGEWAEPLEQFYRNSQVEPPEISFKRAFSSPPRKALPSADDEKTVLKTVKSELNPSWWRRVMGGEKPKSDSALRLRSKVAAGFYSDMATASWGAPTEGAALRAVAMTEDVVEDIGPWAMYNPEGRSSTADRLGITRREAGELVADTITLKARAQGVDSVTDAEIFASGDQDYMVSAYDSDGVPIYFSITQEELEDRIGQGPLQREKPRPDYPWPTGRQ